MPETETIHPSQAKQRKHFAAERLPAVIMRWSLSQVVLAIGGRATQLGAIDNALLADPKHRLHRVLDLRDPSVVRTTLQLAEVAEESQPQRFGADYDEATATLPAASSQASPFPFVEQQLPAFLRNWLTLVAGHRYGQLVMADAAEMVQFIAALASGLPSSRQLEVVVSTSVDTAHRLRGRVERVMSTLNGMDDVAPRIEPEACLGRITWTIGARTPGTPDPDVVILIGSFRGKRARLLDSVPALIEGRRTCFALVDATTFANRTISEAIFVTGIAGPVLRGHLGERSVIHLGLATGTVAGTATDIDSKIILVWKNGPRNEEIARIVQAIMSKPLVLGIQGLLSPSIPSPQPQPRIAVLVEGVDHARELRKLLPVPLVDRPAVRRRSTATRLNGSSMPGVTIVTAAAAEELSITPPDVVVCASASPPASWRLDGSTRIDPLGDAALPYVVLHLDEEQVPQVGGSGRSPRDRRLIPSHRITSTATVATASARNDLGVVPKPATKPVPDGHTLAGHTQAAAPTPPVSLSLTKTGSNRPAVSHPTSRTPAPPSPKRALALPRRDGQPDTRPITGTEASDVRTYTSANGTKGSMTRESGTTPHLEVSAGGSAASNSAGRTRPARSHCGRSSKAARGFGSLNGEVLQ